MVDAIEALKWVAIVFIGAIIAQIAKSLTKGCLGKQLERLFPGAVKAKPAEAGKPGKHETELEKERLKAQEKLEKKKLKLKKKKLKMQEKRLKEERKRRGKG